MANEATPGPWVQFCDRGQAVAIMPAMRPGEVCSFEGSGLPEREANARLIESSPDLLNALKFASTDPCFQMLGSVTREVVEAAIAKASPTNPEQDR